MGPAHHANERNRSIEAKQGTALALPGYLTQLDLGRYPKRTTRPFSAIRVAQGSLDERPLFASSPSKLDRQLTAQVLPSSQCPLASAGREADSNRILHKITCPAGPVRPTLNAARHLRAQKRSFEVLDTKPGSRRSNPGSSNSKRVHRKNASYKGRWATSG